MSEFTVGEAVVVKSYQPYSSRTVLNIRKITKITPTGRIRLEGTDVQYDKSGHAMGSSSGEILHKTPELIEQVRLYRARNKVLSATSHLPSILTAERLSVEECERIVAAAEAYQAVLNEIIAAHAPPP